jgi:transcriptional regulator with XRE-family HTH domain
MVDGAEPIARADTTTAAAGAGLPGPIVRRARQAAGLTLAQLGARCGYSASTVSRLERGKQPLRDVVVLATIADALHIPPEVLGLAPHRRHGLTWAPGSALSPTGVARVNGDPGLGDGEDPVRRRDLLTGIAGLAGGAALAHMPLPSNGPISPAEFTAGLTGVLYGPAAHAEPVPLVRLRTAVTAARADFQAARYRKLAATLPATIQAAAAARAAAGDDPAAHELLTEAYLAASNLLVKVNDDQLAWATADRAAQAAEHGNDPLLLADARRSVATVLRRTGHPATGQRLLLAAAEDIQPGPAATPDQLSIYGMLLAVAAYTAAVDGARDTAHDLIGEAAAAAARLGYDGNHRHTAFGPTNVSLYRLSIAQVLGDNGTAVEHAKTIRPAAIPTLERRGRYWIDLARAYHQWGKPQHCYQALLHAEQAAPADVRYRPPVHRMIDDLLRADRRQSLPDLPAFARRIGLQPGA